MQRDSPAEPTIKNLGDREAVDDADPALAMRAAGAVGAGAGFRRVLVCLDRSQAAEAVLPLVTHLAQADRARVTLVHVLSGPAEDRGVGATDALEWEIARQEGRAYLDSLVEELARQGVRADGRIDEGAPAHHIVASATELDADLLVLSTHGVGGQGAWTLGGTAQKILALARGAVLIAPASDRLRTPRVPPQRLLVPLDGSLRGETVLPTAVRLARAADAEIVLAHVVHDPIRTEVLSTPEDIALATQLADRLMGRAAEYLERIRSQLAPYGRTTTLAVTRAADQRDGLVTLAAAREADLVVMSAHGATCNPRNRFGSVTAHVITHAPAPVLVLQDLTRRPRHSGPARHLRSVPRPRFRALGGA